MRQVVHLTRGLASEGGTHVYFLSDGGRGKEGDLPPAGYDFLPSLFSGDGLRVSFVLRRMDARSALFHMMNADMLVMTGSSFPYVAALFSYKPVVLMAVPKEGRHYGIYRQHDTVLLDQAGSITSPTMSEVRMCVHVLGM